MANFRYSHLHTTSAITSADHEEVAALINDAEIALNIGEGHEAIYFKNENGDLIEVGVGISYTKDEADGKFATKEEVESGFTKVGDVLKDIQDGVSGLTDDVEALKTKDFVEYTTFDGTRKTIQLANHNSISGLMTDTPADKGYPSDKVEGVNLVMVSKWNVADFGSVKLPINLNGAKGRPTYNDTNEIALLSDVESGNTYADETFFSSVEYADGTITFYAANGDELDTIDASDFIKDGMVDKVEITGETGEKVLVITFNTDSGKEKVELPLTDIFDASNYYNKDEVDAELVKKADTATTYTKTDVDDLLDAVSGVVSSNSTKIDTISGQVTANTDAIDALEGNVIVSGNTGYNGSNDLMLTLTKENEGTIEVNMNVTDQGGILIRKNTAGPIILSAGTF